MALFLVSFETLATPWVMVTPELVKSERVPARTWGWDAPPGWSAVASNTSVASGAIWIFFSSRYVIHVVIDTQCIFECITHIYIYTHVCRRFQIQTYIRWNERCASWCFCEAPHWIRWIFASPHSVNPRVWSENLHSWTRSHDWQITFLVGEWDSVCAKLHKKSAPATNSKIGAKSKLGVYQPVLTIINQYEPL